MVLGVSELIGVWLPLGVVRVGAKPASRVCSRCRFRPEGTHDTGWAGVPASWILGDPVTLNVCKDVVASPVILGISEYLVVRLPLGVVKVCVEPLPLLSVQVQTVILHVLEYLED